MPRFFSTLLVFILLQLVTTTFSHGQNTTIKGTIKDASTNEVIPYVNIGIKKKNVGTAAGENGGFSLQIGNNNLNDTLTFSAVGYHELKLPIKSILAGRKAEFILSQKTASLQEVVISSRAPKIRKFGTTSRNPLISGTAQRPRADDIIEFAKLIKINGKPSEVIAATIYLKSWKIDSATFRINFYRNAAREPNQRIIEKSIIRRLPLNKGWTTIGLEQNSLWVQEDFFISFEYLPDSSHKEKYLFIYGGALGGGTLTRSVSLGKWKEVSGATLAAYVTVRQ